MSSSESERSVSRSILHVDMDCFYAAVELRENPHLRGRPVAVGGRSGRGVLTTCNYEARKYGCHSAMPVFQAVQKCPDLVLLPVRFDLYREESAKIRQIFSDYTDLVEPLSLDEAFLDVSHLRSEGESIAWEIRRRIREELQLTASAGIAHNKFLAKIGSDWNKPDGQFALLDESRIATFLQELPVEKIWGVGKQTAKRLHRHRLRTCGDLQKWEEYDLVRVFGKFGRSLYRLCRGQDDRPVNPSRQRKSISSERTFRENIDDLALAQGKLQDLHAEISESLQGKLAGRQVKETFVKLKFDDFTITSIQTATSGLDEPTCAALLDEAWERRGHRKIRLLGLGVRFHPEKGHLPVQMEMF